MSTLKTNAIQTIAGKTILNSSGSILQVVSATKTNTFSTNTGWGEVPGLSVSITPSSTTSKILVTANLSSSQRNGAYSAYYRLARNGTAIILGDAEGSRTRTTTGGFSDYYGYATWPYNFTYLDSPSSTSSLTYSIQAFDPYNQTIYLNRPQNDTDLSFYGRGTSTITAMEVA